MTYTIEAVYDFQREPASIILNFDFYYLMDLNSFSSEFFSITPDFIFCFYQRVGSFSCGFLDKLNAN
jgi:hypothetical protein